MTSLTAETSTKSELSRKERKEEGKRQKRQRIEESSGVRPRSDTKTDNGPIRKVNNNNNTINNKAKKNVGNKLSKHRFGRVMEKVPCRNKPRFSTLSIALPGSVLSNCQTKELRTLLVGQIARAATIYHVDEIIVFDDKLSNNNDRRNHGVGGWREFKRRKHGQSDDSKQDALESTSSPGEKNGENDHDKEDHIENRPRSNHQEFMARLLQYCECPQYLRRNFFPMHPDLQFAGLLAPIDAPHHVRAEDNSKYREGVVLNKSGPNGNSLVNCGIRNRLVE
jgi:hypothetical protein